MFDRVANEILADKVIIDDLLAAYQAVNYLIEEGRKKIALITTVDYVSVGKLRTEGYIKALTDHNITIDEKIVLKIEDIDNCSDVIQKLIIENEIDAVFAVNELFAVVAIKEALKKGVKIPEEMSVIAFTDGIISKFSTPTITTVSQNGVKMGRKAAEMLIERLETEDEEEERYRTEVIETNLISRESTKT